MPAFDPLANYKCAATGRTVQMLYTATNSQATPTLTARAAVSGAPVYDGGSSSGSLSTGGQAGIAVASLIVAIVGVIGMYAFGCFSCLSTRGASRSYDQGIPLVRRE